MPCLAWWVSPSVNRILSVKASLGPSPRGSPIGVVRCFATSNVDQVLNMNRAEPNPDNALTGRAQSGNQFSNASAIPTVSVGPRRCSSLGFLHKRRRGWTIGLAALGLCLAGCGTGGPTALSKLPSSTRQLTPLLGGVGNLVQGSVIHLSTADYTIAATCVGQGPVEVDLVGPLPMSGRSGLTVQGASAPGANWSEIDTLSGPGVPGRFAVSVSAPPGTKWMGAVYSGSALPGDRVAGH